MEVQSSPSELTVGQKAAAPTKPSTRKTLAKMALRWLANDPVVGAGTSWEDFGQACGSLVADNLECAQRIALVLLASLAGTVLFLAAAIPCVVWAVTELLKAIPDSRILRLAVAIWILTSVAFASAVALLAAIASVGYLKAPAAADSAKQAPSETSLPVQRFASDAKNSNASQSGEHGNGNSNRQMSLTRRRHSEEITTTIGESSVSQNASRTSQSVSTRQTVVSQNTSNSAHQTISTVSHNVRESTHTHMQDTTLAQDTSSNSRDGSEEGVSEIDCINPTSTSQGPGKASSSVSCLPRVGFSAAECNVSASVSLRPVQQWVDATLPSGYVDSCKWAWRLAQEVRKPHSAQPARQACIEAHDAVGQEAQ